MVDPVRVHRLLRAVRDDLARLECEAAADDTRRSDPMWLRGVKYTFVTAIEGVSTSLSTTVRPMGGGHLPTTATRSGYWASTGSSAPGSPRG